MPAYVHTLTRDDKDFDLEIEFEIEPTIRGRHFADCREPDSGGEIETLTVTYDGLPFILTDAERGEVEQRIYDTEAHEYAF